MKRRGSISYRNVLAPLLLAAGLSSPLCAAAVEWANVETRELLLFYPGQASWEWALTQNDHSGNEKFRAGKNCKACHDGEQEEMGAKIASGEKLEPAPLAGKPGTLPVSIQTASDADRLYVRFQWRSPAPTGTRMDAENAARVAVMLGDDTVKEAARAGCWGACHDDLTGMASAPPDSTMTKYLAASRTKVTRQGGGENYKSGAELQALIDKGAYLEYWQAKLNPGAAPRAGSGYVLDKRRADAEPVVAVTATAEGGKWTVILSRPLKAGGKTHRDLVPGKIYHVGFAVHEDYANHRFHYVSLEHTLSLDQASADFVAKKQ